MWRPVIACAALMLVATSTAPRDSAAKYDELLTLRKIARKQSEIIQTQQNVIEIQRKTIKYLRDIPCGGHTSIASNRED